MAVIGERVAVHTQPKGIRLGVVGVGYWGSNHLRVLASTTNVAAVVGIDQRLADGSGGPAGTQPVARHGVAYAAMEDALPQVDAVIIATPPASHAVLGLQAIAAGKHVLIEKPLATTAAEARELVRAAEDAGVVLMSGHTFAYNPAVHKLRDVVRSREFGELYYLDCARLNLGIYQTDVNVIVDLAPHDISIANIVLAARPTAVTAWGSRHVDPEHEDVAYLRLDYAEAGVRVNMHVSWLDPHKVRRITAVGSKQMAVFDDLSPDERIRVYDRAALPPERGDGPFSKFAYHLGDVVCPYVDFAEPLAVQDQHFVDCITAGTRPWTDGASGLSVVEVLDCAQISLVEQRPVLLTEVTQHELPAASAAAMACTVASTA
jgi:predicted dehydrogenase